MAGTSGTRTTSRKKAGSANKPNRAQLRAMEIRAAESVGTAHAGVAVAGAAGAVAINRRVVNRPVARAVALTREQEMRYVRSDLRRLLYTAGILFVIMIALLVILD